jgi:spore germination cell wall hydrolase CwlJ-like protein
MLGVAEVIRNRTVSKFYSDGSVIDTVLKPYQFSGWNTNDINRVICGKVEMDNPLVSLALKAWKTALNNKTELTSGAVFYHSRFMTPFPDWTNNVVRTTVIGDHIFYREK